MSRVACLSVAVLLACTRPMGSPAPAPETDVHLEGVTVRNYRGSRVHLVARAPRVDLVRSSMDLWAFDAGLWLAENEVTMEAPEVVGNVRSGRLEGRKGVTLSTPDGVRGSAPSITYERSAGRQGAAFGDAGVRLTHPKFEHEAAGVVVDFAEHRATFDEPRTTTFARE